MKILAKTLYDSSLVLGVGLENFLPSSYKNNFSILNKFRGLMFAFIKA